MTIQRTRLVPTTRLAGAAWVFRAATGLVGAMAAWSLLSMLAQQEYAALSTTQTRISLLLHASAIFLAGMAWTTPKHTGYAPAQWRAWLRRRIHARAGIWLVPLLGSAGAMGFWRGWAAPGTMALCAGAVALSVLLARVGPNLSSQGMAFWARSPLGRAWQWMCPLLDPGACPTWRHTAAQIVDQQPDLDGQSILVQHQKRIQIIPMTPSQDPEFVLGYTDPFVLLHLPYDRLRAIAHGRQAHVLMHHASYGGIAATGNACETAKDTRWLVSWLDMVGDRDPIMGKHWPLHAPTSAHEKMVLATAKRAMSQP